MEISEENLERLKEFAQWSYQRITVLKDKYRSKKAK